MQSISLQLCVNMWIYLYYPAWGLLQFQIWKIFSLCSSDIATSLFLFFCSWELHLDLFGLLFSTLLLFLKPLSVKILGDWG